MATKPDYLQRLRQHLGEVTSVSASDAKNQFGQVLESALRDGAVVITKHAAPKAVLLSIDELERLTERRKLDTLTDEFDALYARMQRPGAAAAMQTAFDATPKQLGAAAVRAARKKR